MKESLLNNFVDTIWSCLNPDMLKVTSSAKNKGFYVCLSTAAPESYASIISKRLSFDGFCATLMPQKGTLWKENVKCDKCEHTLSMLNREDVSLAIFVTDHYDDLPLLQIEKEENIVVNPSNKTRHILMENNIGYSEI